MALLEAFPDRQARLSRLGSYGRDAPIFITSLRRFRHAAVSSLDVFYAASATQERQKGNPERTIGNEEA
jgi:hypothetical protein